MLHFVLFFQWVNIPVFVVENIRYSACFCLRNFIVITCFSENVLFLFTRGPNHLTLAYPIINYSLTFKCIVETLTHFDHCSLSIRSLTMAHKLPNCRGEPAVSHWHRPSAGFPWHQPRSSCPELWPMHLHQYRQQWTLCSCGVWWLWWPLRWDKWSRYLSFFLIARIAASDMSSTSACNGHPFRWGEKVV